MTMTISKASLKAIRYACKFYHYAHHAPAGNVLGYAVFNDDVFCGVVTFGSGANNNIGTQYGLKQGEVCELTRVALNGKQTTTSQVVAMCLRRLQFVRKYYDHKAEAYTTKGKRKYLMPLNKSLRKKLLPLAKPYDKDPEKMTYKESHPEEYAERAAHKTQSVNNREKTD